jgi:hypothetical protein
MYKKGKKLQFWKTKKIGRESLKTYFFHFTERDLSNLIAEGPTTLISLFIFAIEATLTA